MDAEGSFVAALDVGTTIVKCRVYDRSALCVGQHHTTMNLEHPQPGWTEMRPDAVWDSVVQVIRAAIASANLAPRQISCLGMSTLRNTFVTWDKETGEPYHNFISWTDLRADEAVNAWNSSFSTRATKFAAGVLYRVTRNRRYMAAAALRLTNTQVSARLAWVLDNVPGLREAAEAGRALFGTVDTWLLWKFSEGTLHVTDYSCASSTGLFDPFLMEWSKFALSSFRIPSSMLPETRDTSGLFCACPPGLFGAAVPVTASVADQQASTFGQCCFEAGDVKCTMGTGGFVDLNTGDSPHASVTGIYPLVGWKIGGEAATYLAEASVNDLGTAVSWARSVGLFDDPEDSSDLARTVPDSGGTYFVPAFGGLQVPINDHRACAGFVGITRTTSKAHMCRAVLESLAFRVRQIFGVMVREARFPLGPLRCDGGVSNNDFAVQLIADLTGRRIERPAAVEMSSLGAAFLAGLAVGVWKSKEELRPLGKTDRRFEPGANADAERAFERWTQAVERCGRWYT